MKKLFILIVAIALAMTVRAQSEWNIGPKLGLNLSNVSNTYDNKTKLGLHFGAFVEYKLDSRWAVQSELIYSRQGYRQKDVTIGEGNSKEKVKGRLRLNYLNIPMMAKFYIFDGFNVEAGPQIGILLNGKSKIKMGDTEEKESFKVGNALDLSLGLGVGYELGMGIFASARYNFALTNAIDKDVVGDGNKNHVFQISFGWKIKM